MLFNDEFELDLYGKTFYIEVEGNATKSIDVTSVKIFDSLGEELDDTHEYYNEIYEEALNREYEVEVHSADFDYYKDDFNNFLREDEF